MWRWSQRSEGCIYQPRNTEDRQQPPEAGREAWNRSISLGTFRETVPPPPSPLHAPVDTSVSDFWPPELGENPFLLF